MFHFWDEIMKPVIELKNLKHIVEIGADKGQNTLHILEFCKSNGAKLSSIDPVPQFDVLALKEQYAGHFDLYEDLSLNALPLITDYDVILIDGDHNWYTVYNELKIIEKTFECKDFPVIFLHDTCWPYGRRDMYYAPDNIPTEYRHPYKYLGMIPGQSELCEGGGMNASYNNAIYENTPKNGVYTAIEDFISQSKQALYVHTYNAHFGLTLIVAEKDKKLYDYFTTLYSKIMNISTSCFIEMAISFTSMAIERNEYVQLYNESMNLLKKYDSQLSLQSALLHEKGK